MVDIMYLNEQGQRIGSPLSVSCAQLRLADLIIDAKVIVVAGLKAGVTGKISVSLFVM